MTRKVGVIWEGPLLFTRLIEDCGHSSELITPQILAAPFFRKRFHGLVIPSGFALEVNFRILAALRAISPRIRTFVREGGTLLVFGAWADRADAYDWLPVPLTYRHRFSETSVSYENTDICASILEKNTDTISIDGILDDITCNNGGQVVLRTPEGTVMAVLPHGKGRILVTTIHEYPSRRFMQEFCLQGSEGLL